MSMAEPGSPKAPHLKGVKTPRDKARKLEFISDNIARLEKRAREIESKFTVTHDRVFGQSDVDSQKDVSEEEAPNSSLEAVSQGLGRLSEILDSLAHLANAMDDI